MNNICSHLHEQSMITTPSSILLTGHPASLIVDYLELKSQMRIEQRKRWLDSHSTIKPSNLSKTDLD